MSLTAAPASAETVVVTVTGLADAPGEVGCALHAEPSTFPTGEGRSVRVAPTEGVAVCRFENVAPGGGRNRRLSAHFNVDEPCKRSYAFIEIIMKAFLMGQLTVRDVDDALIAALKARAAASGRSMEAEHRQLLREALDADRRAINDFKAAAARLRARIGAAPAGAPMAEDIVRDMRDSR